MNNSLKLSALFAIFSVATLLLATAAYAKGGCGDGVCSNIACLSLDCPPAESHEDCPEDCGTRANCHNGILDVEETKIDCGGVCWTSAEEVCDGKDNDGDCSVDEGPYDVGNICDPSTWTSFCYNGVLDRFEQNVDCGYVCRTNAAEICDGKDNDKDCQIDENCGVEAAPSSLGVGAGAAPSSPGDSVEGGASPIPQPIIISPNEPSCNDGIQNQGESGVDCGGICMTSVEPEPCDFIDNDKDCLVDEDGGCPEPGYQTQAIGLPEEQPGYPAQQDPCKNGIQDGNNLEGGVDCGGSCLALDVAEVCDGIDNNRDCVVDNVPYVNCALPEQGSPEQAPVSYPGLPPGAYPAQMGTPTEIISGTQAEEIPATPAPTPEELAALTDEQIDALIEQNDGADFIKQMRKLADDKGVYVPKDESDVQFGRKYLRYIFKHQSEFAAKFEAKDPTEDDFADILKQFSREAYPQQVQQQSFFSKVAGFFKRLFG